MKIVVGEFDARRKADRALERQVQEYGMDRIGVALRLRAAVTGKGARLMAAPR